MFKYAPAWLDSNNNRLVFRADCLFFDEFGDAANYQLSHYAYYLDMDLKMDSVVSFKTNENGDIIVPHLEIKYGPYNVLCIDGPLFLEAKDAN